MTRIEAVEITPNPVTAGERITIQVTLATHRYLGQFTHNTLKAYQHAELESCWSAERKADE